MSQQDDQLIALIAAFDQFASTMRNFVDPVRSYHQELRKAGFDKQEALALTLQFQDRLFDTAGMGKRA